MERLYELKKMLRRALGDRKMYGRLIKEKEIDLEYWEDRRKETESLIELLEKEIAMINDKMEKDLL